MLEKFQNPILPGFHPDPSICRANDDFYIVNSTFEFFPGVPISHSKNLAQWTYLGHCLTSPEQLHLTCAKASGGIYAPTIRFHEGIFYMTTTNVSDQGNFIVHSKSPDKGWSAPFWVDQGGRDPSLFFDEDGKVYFTSTGNLADGSCTIQMCEINPLTGERYTQSRVISQGCAGKFPEGPHLYKRHGFYYLMQAEGGTEYGHMETIQRSTDIYGPYEACPHNPILTHRDDVRGEICCTGHGDLVEDQHGNWWMVCLGTRPLQGEYGALMLHNLGRETFLVPVTWGEDDWPYAGEHGKVLLEMTAALPDKLQEEMTDGFVRSKSFKDDFTKPSFDYAYSFLRNPSPLHYMRDTKQHRLLLKGSKETLQEAASPTWIGIRQKEHEVVFEATVGLLAEQTSGQKGVRAGLTAFYNEQYHYDIYLTKEEGAYYVCLARHIHDVFVVTKRVQIMQAENVRLKVQADGRQYQFFYRLEENPYICLGSGLTAGLCTEGTATMTFTGTFLGMFAENTEAAFEELSCQY
ncbi:MAG: glycoside hydrolase family 43 protein [Lachnospiraceae bacterium]